MLEPKRNEEEAISEPEPRLTEAETWALLRSMRGILTGAFEQYGGSEEWLRRHRYDEDAVTL